jgi:hypothetical protein
MVEAYRALYSDGYKESQGVTTEKPRKGLFRKSNPKNLKEIQRFIGATSFRLLMKHTGKATSEGAIYKKVVLVDDQVIDAGQVEGFISPFDFITWLIYCARNCRDYPAVNQYYEKDAKLARKIFGDHYDSLVNMDK